MSDFTGKIAYWLKRYHQKLRSKCNTEFTTALFCKIFCKVTLEFNACDLLLLTEHRCVFV